MTQDFGYRLSPHNTIQFPAALVRIVCAIFESHALYDSLFVESQSLKSQIADSG